MGDHVEGVMQLVNYLKRTLTPTEESESDPQATSSGDPAGSNQPARSNDESDDDL